MNLFKCSDTFCLHTRQSGIFSFFARPNNKQTVEICIKTHIPKNPTKGHQKATENQMLRKMEIFVVRLCGEYEWPFLG